MEKKKYETPSFETVIPGEDFIRTSSETGDWTLPGDDGKPESGSADIFAY